MLPRYLHGKGKGADAVLGDQAYSRPAVGTDARLKTLYQARYTAHRKRVNKSTG